MSRFEIAGAERAGSRHGITWYTLVGLVLVPLAVGGLLLWSLDNPSARLDRMTAAVVNEDQPVTLDGKTVPLGRELAAGLVGKPATAHAGSTTKNFTWVITDPSDAYSGLKDGRYTAVVTIPKDFSRAAISTADPSTAHRARIRVQSTQQGGLLDGALSSTVTGTATEVFGRALARSYLDNVYVGFTTLRDKLGQAHTGATDLADGAGTAADGLGDLRHGAQSLAGGASTLGSGLDRLGSAAASLASGASGAASGAGHLASGAGTLADSLRTLHTKLSGTDGLHAATSALASGSAGVAQGSSAVADGTASVSQGLSALRSAACAAGDPLCAQLTALEQGAAQTAAAAGQTASGAKQVADGAHALDRQAEPLVAGIGQAASGAQSLAQGGKRLSSGLGSLATGAGSLSQGIDATASGATTLSSGAAGLASGATSAQHGVESLATGAGKVADGLGKAASSIPSYSSAQRTRLADTVTNPVTASGASSALFSSSAVPFLASLALWVGALALFVVLRARSRRTLTSSASTARLVARSMGLPLMVGLAQGLVVAGVAQISLDLSPTAWLSFAGLAALSGASFAALLHGVVAHLRATGLFAAAVAGALALATGIVSTAPTLLVQISAALPVHAASEALLGAVTGTGAGGPFVVLVLWCALGVALSALAVVRGRTVSRRALASASAGSEPLLALE